MKTFAVVLGLAIFAIAGAMYTDHKIMGSGPPAAVIYDPVTSVLSRR